jgi:hypothetical protein
MREVQKITLQPGYQIPALPEYGQLGLAWVAWVPHSGMGRAEVHAVDSETGYRYPKQFGAPWAYNEIALHFQDVPIYIQVQNPSRLYHWWRLPTIQELMHVSAVCGAEYRELYRDGCWVWTNEGATEHHAVAVDLCTGEFARRYRVEVENLFCRAVKSRVEVDSIGEMLL